MFCYDRYFELEISGYDDNWQPKWKRTQLGSDSAYRLIYTDVLYCVLCFALPLISLVFMNWRVIVGYRAARRRRRSILTRQPQATTQVTTGDNIAARRERRSCSSARHPLSEQSDASRTFLQDQDQALKRQQLLQS